MVARLKATVFIWDWGWVGVNDSVLRYRKWSLLFTADMWIVDPDIGKRIIRGWVT
jgi:hypothetical protein